MAVNVITLTAGTLARAEDVEAKVNPLYTSIDNTNISAGAGIVFSKLDSSTVAGVTASQTLTNKTLTTPTITTPTINGNTALNGVLTIIAASAVDTQLKIDPYTSGSRLLIDVPATGDKADFDIGTTPHVTMRITAGQHECVINEDSNDVDFRVETNTNANALKFDAQLDTATFGVSTAVNNAFSITAASAVDTTLSMSGFSGGTSFSVHVPAAGSRATFYLSTVPLFDMQPTELVVNEDGRTDVDFRVETDSSANGIFVDASANTVLIGGTSSQAILGTGAIVKAQTAVDTTFEISPATSGNGLKFITGATGNRTTVYSGALAYADYYYTSATEGSIVFNEDSNDVDFRVETNGQSSAFFLDGGLDLASFAVPVKFPAIAAVTTATTANYGYSQSLNKASCAYTTAAGTTTPSDGINVASVTNGTSGVYTVTFVTSFANTTYQATCTSRTAGAYFTITTKNTGSCVVTSSTAGNASFDFVAFGLQ